MKRINLFVLLMIIVMAACLFAGCGLSQADSQASADVSEETADASDDAEETQDSETDLQEDEADTDLSEEALAAAEDLYTKLKAYAGTDYDAFAALYRNTSEDMILSDYEAEWSSEADSDKQNYVIINSSGNYYAVCVSDYIVTGSSPNTSVNAADYNLTISLEDGEWLLDLGEDCLNALNEDLNEIVYPQDLIEAVDAGRNATVFGNYMYLDETSTFDGTFYNEVKFAWQNEDGSVTVGVWAANGTGENISIQSANYITLTDSELGEILNVSGSINESVKAGYSMIFYFTVNADEISSGTGTWSSVSAETSLKTDESEGSADDTGASTETGSTQTCSNCGGTGVVTQTSQYYDAALGWQTNTYTTACPTCGGTGVVSY